MSGGVLLQALVSGLSVGAVYGLVGVGFTLVWSLTRVLALAHGDIVVGSVLLAVLAVVGRTPVALSPGVGHSVALVVLTLAIGLALSVLSYVVAVRPFLDRRHRSEDVMGWVAGGVTAGLVIRTSVALALPPAPYARPDPVAPRRADGVRIARPAGRGNGGRARPAGTGHRRTAGVGRRRLRAPDAGRPRDARGVGGRRRRDVVGGSGRARRPRRLRGGRAARGGGRAARRA